MGARRLPVRGIKSIQEHPAEHVWLASERRAWGHEGCLCEVSEASQSSPNRPWQALPLGIVRVVTPFFAVGSDFFGASINKKPLTISPGSIHTTQYPLSYQFNYQTQHKTHRLRLLTIPPLYIYRYSGHDHWTTYTTTKVPDSSTYARYIQKDAQ